MDYFALAYALTVFAGGFIGYWSKGSTASLASGVVFGGLCAFAAATANDKLLLGACGVLAAVMGYRAYNTHKFMPAGLVFILSLLMIGRTLMRMSSGQ